MSGYLAPGERADPDDLLRGRFRKSFEPYGVRITRSTLDEIDDYDDCKVGYDDDLPGLYYVTVETHEGTLQAGMGDWIFEDSQGRHYPIEHEEMCRIYEPVGELEYVGVIADNVGQVVPAQVDALLSCETIDMWDEEAAETATIASLLVAHRVAGERQETWRTREIADVVKGRVGQVTEDDVPDSVLADVEAEVERRLQAEAV